MVPVSVVVRYQRDRALAEPYYDLTEGVLYLSAYPVGRYGSVGISLHDVQVERIDNARKHGMQESRETGGHYAPGVAPVESESFKRAVESFP